MSDLAAEVGVSLSPLSQQLAVLRQSGLVVTRQDGTTEFSAIKYPLLVDLLTAARELLIAGLEETKAVLEAQEAS